MARDHLDNMVQGMKPFTKADFLRKSRAKHGDDLYDYSNTNFLARKQSINIDCFQHGTFAMKPYIHWRGCGCPECRKDPESRDPFLSQVAKVLSDRYDVVDASDLKHVAMNCAEHGCFVRTATELCTAIACPDCGARNKQEHGLSSTEEFIERARQVHEDRYDYGSVQYTKSGDKVDIICPKHGLFQQVANNHLKGHGCNACGEVRAADNHRHTQEWFLEQAAQVHGDKYEYGRARYDGMKTHIIITCRKHGDFQQTAECHLLGCGCRQCSNPPGHFSQKACDWLDDMAVLDGIYIQHALNGGEHLIKELNKKVDGYAPETGEVFEFHGSIFHGDPRVYERSVINPINKKTMGDLYDETMRQEQRLRCAGYVLHTMWEAEFDLATFMTGLSGDRKRARSEEALAADTLVSLERSKH